MASEEKYDIAIIGGGVIGLSCAWRLAQGGAKVAVFKRKDNRKSASWAAAGMLAPLVEAARYPAQEAKARDAMLQLTLQSRDLYPTFTEELSGAGQPVSLSLNPTIAGDSADGFSSGILYLATDENDKARANFETWTDHSGLKQVDFHEENWKSYVAQWQCPQFAAYCARLADEKRVFHLSQEGWVNNRQLWDALRQAAQSAGVQILNDAVRGVECNGQQIQEIVAYDHRVRCAKVLLCAGAWSNDIKGLPTDCVPPVRAVKGHIVKLSSPRQMYSKVIYTSHFYMVPRGTEVLVGSTMEERDDFWRDAHGIWHILNEVQKVFPELLQQKLTNHWTGLRPATPDGLPILGRTPIENLFVATGHFRNGILLTPITAQLMADCLLNGKEVPREFSMARFHQ